MHKVEKKVGVHLSLKFWHFQFLPYSRFSHFGSAWTINFLKFTDLEACFEQVLSDFRYEVRDINGLRQTGFMPSHGTLANGLRCSTAKAFLRPVSGRPNLHVSLQSHVEKLLIDSVTKQAIGVRINKLGALKDIHANKEVLLSAGSIQSPQLLMLSGIGPKAELSRHHIDLVLDVPGVGQNLQDHVAMGGGTYLFDPPKGDREDFGFILHQAITETNVQEFMEKKGGWLYGLPACEAMAFVNTKYADPAEDWPDVQLFLGKSYLPICTAIVYIWLNQKNFKINFEISAIY